MIVEAMVEALAGGVFMVIGALSGTLIAILISLRDSMVEGDAMEK